MSNSFDDKKKFIEQATKSLDKTFDVLAAQLYKAIISDFIDKLDRDGDQIANTSKNLQLIALIESIYNDFSIKYLPSVAQQVITGTDKISAYNVDYFSEFATEGRDYQATTQKVQRIVRDRLGVTAAGNGKKVTLKPGGYMDSLLKDNTVKNQIKNLSYNEVIKGGGFTDLKKGLETFIVGDEQKLGGFKQYYRQYAYDIYTQVDRQESTLIATELDLEYFIYEGTLIETSRDFCIKRAGKLFSIKEAEKWKDDPWIKKNIEKGYIASYNPITDMGLFGCRHTPRFVSKAVAKSMRPDIVEPQTPAKDKQARPKRDSGPRPPQFHKAKEVEVNGTKAINFGREPINTEHLKQVKAKAAKQYPAETHSDVTVYDSGGVYAQHNEADKADLPRNSEVGKLLASLGENVEVLKHSVEQGVKNPELSINGKIADHKTPKASGSEAYESITTPIQRSATDAVKDQGGTSVVISLTTRYTPSEIIEGVRRAFKFNPGLESMYLNYQDKAVTKIERENFANYTYLKIIQQGYVPPL